MKKCFIVLKKLLDVEFDAKRGEFYNKTLLFLYGSSLLKVLDQLNDFVIEESFYNERGSFKNVLN